MKRIMLGSLLAVAFAFGSGAATAGTVLRVIVVEVRDVKAYVHEVETLQAQYKKANVPLTLRVWRATFAGPDAGTVIVSVEMPDLATLAKVADMQKSNTEIAATMQRINAQRHIVSDSLYEEISP
jgi:hypothetical protein